MPNTRAIGVAYSDQAINGGSVDNTPIGATTASSGAFTTLTSTGNSMLGDAAADLVGFHGAQVAQASYIATVTASTTITAQTAAINAILTILANKGLMASS